MRKVAIIGMGKIKLEKKKWEKDLLSQYVKKGESKDTFETPSGIPLNHKYSPIDIEKTHYMEDLGFPGKASFTRGVYPIM